MIDERVNICQYVIRDEIIEENEEETKKDNKEISNKMESK